jgi:hypothetical protein
MGREVGGGRGCKCKRRMQEKKTQGYQSLLIWKQAESNRKNDGGGSVDSYINLPATRADHMHARPTKASVSCHHAHPGPGCSQLDSFSSCTSARRVLELLNDGSGTNYGCLSSK